MPTVTIGPVTPGSGSATKVLAYVPITVTNSQASALPVYFQADVNITSNSPALFSGATTAGST